MEDLSRLTTWSTFWHHPRLRRGVLCAVTVWAAAMYALMFIHLLADFPRGAPWSDMSKATDEGWYGGGALHHFVFGHWYLPASFNPTVAMPMWPLMLGGWFSVVGVGMLQARLLAVMLCGASLMLLVVLLRQEECGWLTCAGASLLILANPFCYVFDRMALLEPVSVFWWIFGLWVAGRAAAGGWWRAIGTGLAIVALVWAKTTAIVLVPSILYFIYGRATKLRHPWVRPAFIATMTAVIAWLLYFFAWVRPRYLVDFKFLFTINNYRSHLTILPKILWQALSSGLWINPVLFPLGLAIVVVAVFWMRRLWSRSLFASAVLAAGFELALIIYHGNFQPRYYLVVAIPLVIVIVMGVDELWRKGIRRTALLSSVVLIGVAGIMTRTTLEYALHPAFSHRDMAMAVADRMQSNKTAVLLGEGSDDISLFTGVRAISFYQPYGLQPLLNRYQPKWIGVWLPSEQNFVRQVKPDYELQEVATFRVYDDQPGHNIFVLYRTVPRGGGVDGTANE